MEEKLKRIQKTELDGLLEIKRICEENDLSYSIAFGTMLGAVRHKGFIPWDDDTDVYMPMKDIKSFEKNVKTEKFFFSNKKKRS